MSERDPDLNVPEKRTYFANIYREVIGSCGSVYSSRILADQMAGPGRIACVAFTVDLEERAYEA